MSFSIWRNHTKRRDMRLGSAAAAVLKTKNGDLARREDRAAAGVVNGKAFLSFP